MTRHESQRARGNALGRLLRHAAATQMAMRRAFDAQVLDRIERRIAEGERRHSAEIRFVVEASLEPGRLVRGETPRDRAAQLFAQLRVWDTELNNGVLVYVLYADHAVEIVADRAATRAIPEPEWQAVCEAMSRAFRERAFERGCIEAVDRLNALLEREFPPGSAPRGELPDRPTLI